jgi:uncharacterized protein (TIGR03437 family)
MKRIVLFLLAVCAPVAAEIRLPASMMLAGPLDDVNSFMGDDAYHYPFGEGSGSVKIHGRVIVQFNPPQGRIAHFFIRWQAEGDLVTFPFSSGGFFRMTGQLNLPSAVALSQADLNLDTGEVTNIELHSIFQNTIIRVTARYNRFPLLTDAHDLTVFFGDFPALVSPTPLPYTERPPQSLTAKFIVDSSQRITGFEFHGVTFVPLTILPGLGMMPPFAFVRGGTNIAVPGVQECQPNIPPSQCPSEQNLPDGLLAPDNLFLNPHLHLVSPDMREIAAPRATPPAIPGGGVMAAAAAPLGATLYVFGGLSGSAATARGLAYAPAQNAWTAVPDMPRAVTQHCAAAAGTRLYVAGGRERTDSAPLATVSAYDPAARTWSSVAPLPEPVAGAACASLDGRLYVFGGWTAARTVSDSVWSFNPATGQWAVAGRIPTPLAGSAVAVAGREIVVVNGTEDGRTASSKVYAFSPDSGTWRRAADTMRGLYGATATYLDNRVLVAGGRTSVGGPLDISAAIFQSQQIQALIPSGGWYGGLSPKIIVADAAGAVIGDTWYVVGGDTSAAASGVPTDVVQAFSGDGGWLISSTHPAFTSQLVRNNAGQAVGPAELAPGTVASINGYHLAAETRQAPAVWWNGRYVTTDLPEELAGVRVTIDGVSAGVVSVAPERVDFQVPFGISAGESPRLVTLRVSRSGAGDYTVQVPLVRSAPGIFTHTYGETRANDYLREAGAVAFNQDGTLNYPGQSARAGETIAIRVTGLGDVDTRPEPLQRGPRSPASVLLRPQVRIDGRAAEVQSATLLGGEAGLYELRVTIPRETRAGIRIPVQIESGGVQSNTAVICIQ